MTAALSPRALSPASLLRETWDTPEMSEALAQMLGAQPCSIALERTHFPGSRPVQLVLSVALEPERRQGPGPGQEQGRAGRRTVLAEYVPDDPLGHAASIRASLSKSRHGQKAGFDADAVLVPDGAGLVLRRPGLDERLPGLRLLHDRGFARDSLTGIMGRDAGPVRSELVAHRLGKRAVLRLTGEDVVTYVRLRSIKSRQSDNRTARHLALWHSLSEGGALRIPEPIGAIPDIGADFFKTLPGEPADFATSDTVAVAHAIAALQGLDPQGLPVHRAGDEARILTQWLGRCQEHRPDLARRITPGLMRRIDEIQALPEALYPCHRDLHAEQIRVFGGVAGLLDFDTLCLAHPALDAGNLLAHLCLAGLDEAPLRALLERDGLDPWRSVALYRLAMIYAFTSTPEAVVNRLAREAEGNGNADD